MQPDNINHSFDLPTLAAKDTHLTRSGRGYVGPCPFCGGRDRFLLKPTPAGWRWFCRKCGQGKYHTSIDYLMTRDTLDFKTALERLGGQISASGATQTAPPNHPALPDAAWQRAAWQELDEASDRLLDEPDGQPARDYLNRRGLAKGVCLAHNLGAAPVYDPRLKTSRLAICLPWWDADGGQQTLTAVKYRFVADDPAGLRYVARPSSVFVLFGLAYALQSDQTLLLVEGEINALSIWQCQPPGLSVVSTGSEGGGRPEILRGLAARYRRVLVWLDEPARARALAAATGCPAPRLLQSPQIEGLKWDANRMLQAGELDGFLRQALA